MPTGVYERTDTPKGRPVGIRARTRILTDQLTQLVAEFKRNEHNYLNDETIEKQKAIGKLKSSIHFLLTGEHKSFS